MADRPLLFLDIDGVLNILPGVLESRTAPPDGFETTRVPEGPKTDRAVLVNHEIGRALRALSEDVEILWLSHWNKRATVLGRLLGLPRFDFVACPPWVSSKSTQVYYEVAHRNQWERPIIWVDDQIVERDYEHLQHHLPHAYIGALRPDPAVGLRLQDIDLIRSEIALLRANQNG